MSKTFLVSNGDISYDTSGSPKTIVGKAKLRQDLGEMLAVETQADGFGAGIINLVAYQSNDDGMDSNMPLLLNERLTEASSRFVRMQQQSLTNRTAQETIRNILYIDASVNPTDPTMYVWRIDYETVDGSVRTLNGRLGT